MKTNLSLAITLSIAALAVASSNCPANAQSSGTAGIYGQSDNVTTSDQYYLNNNNYATQDFAKAGWGAPGSGTKGSQAAISRGGLLPTYQATLGNTSDSVDMSSLPSGTFNYGFPNLGAQPYFGPYQNSGTQGSQLPQTSTSSVDINTCDLPFIRMPMEDCPGSGGAGNYGGGSVASNLQGGGGGNGGTNGTNGGYTPASPVGTTPGGNTGNSINGNSLTGNTSGTGLNNNSATTDQNLGALQSLFGSP